MKHHEVAIDFSRRGVAELFLAESRRLLKYLTTADGRG
jgi:hypothetical protein